MDPRPGARRFVAHWPLIVILGAAAVALIGAMRATSTTFDEIVFIAGGARGYETGRFDLVPDHPPLMQYVYGLPVHLSGPTLPDETGVAPNRIGAMDYRYTYAQRFFWSEGNDPERLAFLGRLPAAISALGLIVLVYAFTRAYGRVAATLTASLVAFLPDVLAHGAVAYNDLPLATAFFGTLWATDNAVRRPTPRSGALAGALIGLAICIKVSAAALVPVAALLLAFEATTRRRDVRWARSVSLAALCAVAATYLAIVAVYGGDFTLKDLRFALSFRVSHVTEGHPSSAYLLGELSRTGWWYFFPVAFLFKTSAGLHALLAIGAAALLSAARRSPGRVLRSRLRAPALALVVYGAALLASRLDIGFRYALPVLPLVCIIAAVGAAKLWDSGKTSFRSAIGIAAAWTAVFTLSYYPHFLGFVSEYGPGRDRNHQVFVDSSLDWGQGLLALRDWMSERDVPTVYLSYFGSARPEGYGIRYSALPSFFPLPPQPSAGVEPEYVVVSATNLRGAYLSPEAFARFRAIEPDAVIAYSMYVYRLRD